MKDFAKSIVCNMKTGNKNQDRDVGNIKDDAKAKELHKKMMDAKEIAEEWGRASNYQKKDNLEGGRKAAEDAYRKAKKEYEDYAMNSKTGNEIGNTKVKKTLFKSLATPTTWTPGINGRPILGAPEFKGTFAKDDAEKWTDQWIKDHGFEVENKKTGNDTPLEYSRRKPRVINDDKIGAEEFFKQLSDDVKEREKKDDADIEKVGNAKEWDVKDSDVIEYIYGDPNATKLQRICEKNLGTYDTSKVQALLVDEKSNKWAVVKRGTSAKMKVGNATPNYRYKDFLITNPEGREYIVFLKDGRTVGYRGTTSKAQAEDWCDWHDPKTGKAIENKVGNLKTGNSTWYEPRRMPFQPRSLQYAYEQAKKKGLSGQKLEAEMLRIVKTTPHDAAATESEMRKDVSEWVLSHGKPEDFVNNKRTGNSASDDKFAYVMREFDEGKLKTPDGKVVTDPAQAKAIAYSESKKTENGLARARNAMNKKNPDGLRLKIQDYAGQGLSYQDIVNQLIRFGYDKSDIEAQKEYIKSLIKE